MSHAAPIVHPLQKEKTRMSENGENEQRNRSREPGTHEAHLGNKRLHFFVLFESVLLVMFGVLLSRPTTSKSVLLTLIGLGLVLTILWVYAQARQQYVFAGGKARLGAGAPDSPVPWLKPEPVQWPGSSTALGTYRLPLFVAVVWMAALIFA